MKRVHVAALLVVLVAVPAAAAAAHTFFTSSPRPCFTAGATTYQLSSSKTADYKVRVDNAASQPDLRMQLVDNPDAADFVLVDDFSGGEGASCNGVIAIKTIRVDAAESAPDVTVSLSSEPADHKIFVRSANFSHQDAAALFAVMWKSTHKRNVAGRN
ncbi:MAG: hypothetical protein WCI56_06975 [Hyphomicrobiales bacterium]